MPRSRVSRVDLSIGSIIQTLVMLTLGYVLYNILPPSFSKMASHLVVEEKTPEEQYSSTLPVTIIDSAVTLAISQFYAIKRLIGGILLPASYFSIIIAWRNNSKTELFLSVLLASSLTATAIATYSPSIE